MDHWCSRLMLPFKEAQYVLALLQKVLFTLLLRNINVLRNIKLIRNRQCWQITRFSVTMKYERLQDSFVKTLPSSTFIYQSFTLSIKYDFQPTWRWGMKSKILEPSVSEIIYLFSVVCIFYKQFKWIFNCNWLFTIFAMTGKIHCRWKIDYVYS